jgi:hypothetical protein
VLLLASPLVLSNFLIQPVQASSIGSSSSSVAMTFRTTEPASGYVQCSRTDATLTFDAQGTPSSSNPQRVDITGGTFQISDSSGRQILYGGNINNGRFANSSSGGGGSLVIYTDVNQVPNGTSACASTGDSLTIDTGGCSTSNVNRIEIGFLGQIADGFGTFEGAVECSSQGGNTTTQHQQSSPSMTESSQDRDRSSSRDGNSSNSRDR